MWPENWAVVRFFESIPAGAWTFAPNGAAIGIRPEAEREIRLARGISVAQWRAWFDDLRTMEDEAVQTIREAMK